MDRRLAWVSVWILMAGVLPAVAQDHVSPEVAALQQQVAQLQNELAELRARMDAAQSPAGVIPALSHASPPPTAGAALRPPPPPAATRPASRLPTRDTFGDELTGMARVDTAPPPNDPQLRGFIAIPGTETMFKLGGFAKVNLIHDFGPAGNPDKLVTSGIPIGGGDGRNSNLDANATRFSFEVRRPSSLGPLRFYLENDFYGGAGVTGFRLRQAHAQVGNTYAGYGYSAFTDSDAFPETLDDEGPGSEALRRLASVRQIWKVGDGLTATLSIEDPDSDLNVPSGAAPEQPWPDVVGAMRLERDWGHWQAALLARRIGYRDDDGEQAATGYGINLSGQHHFGDDVLTASIVYGDGVARYFNDLGGNHYDAVVDAQGRVDTLPAYGAHLGYTHHWAGDWRSNLVLSRLVLDSHPLLGADAFRSSTYGALSLIRQASPNFSWGIEALYGKHEVQDGRSADVVRVQGSVKYDFVR